MGALELERLDGAGTRSCFAEIQAVYAEAFPDYDLADHERRTSRQTESSGFEAVIARIDRVLVGFVYGLPLSAGTGWWAGLEPPPPPGFTTETGARTFAVIDLAVTPSCRGRGIGRRLMDELLRPRREDRATLATAPHERQVQQMYERWGWRKVGRAPGGVGETEPWFDLYVIALRPEPASSSR
ncbi:GNAT family N-acetyltransferase [Actinomadura keratinilytica]|jgi:ribosomal protein S18 acetylase RimI-like enzyme|uniref:N-acetyltransferase domain-containing protein n=1 Tax=Actinomadura keratinilytica TaxID=547461 RepID=A0ABP7YYN7_9ACTN